MPYESTNYRYFDNALRPHERLPAFLTGRGPRRVGHGDRVARFAVATIMARMSRIVITPAAF